MKIITLSIAILLSFLSDESFAAKAGAKPFLKLPEIVKTPYAVKRECTNTPREQICITTYSDGTKITLKSRKK